MRCKVYATDEGFGPLVRQSAIIEELLELDPSLEITFQTQRLLTAARTILKGVSFIDRFNNVSWAKLPDGSPDLSVIRETYRDYEERADTFVLEEANTFDYDFVISDFVYEAFEVAALYDVQAFGVAHFTWDWFFSKLFPLPVSTSVLSRWHRSTEHADLLYFPPFTPREILRQYNGRAKQVPLVVRKHGAPEPRRLDSSKFRVMLIDSGSQLLREPIRQALSRVEELTDFQFLVSASSGIEADNVTQLPASQLFVDYIPHVDLVIARAGFNTISECIAYRTPMLLIGEAMNPEMNENMMNIKSDELGSFISLDVFVRRFNTLLPRFVEHEYRSLLHAMATHEIPTDGARIVAQDILERSASRRARYPRGARRPAAVSMLAESA
jgi:hypothetical protein